MQSISGLPSSINGRRLFEYRKVLQASTPISRPSMESPDVKHEHKSSSFKFDTGSAIVLVALVCSILCALCASAVVRYRVGSRRWRGLPDPEIDVSVEGVNGNICKKMDIKALPTTVYDTGSPVAGIDCPICLAEFVDGEKIRVLPECCHSFHVNCIDAWVISNPSCPSCRHSLLYMAAKKSGGVALQSTQGTQMHGNESNDC